MSKPRQHYAFTAAKWMTASSYVTFVTSALNSVIITHALGPRLYGVYAYLVWMMTFTVSLITGGVNLTAIRIISATAGLNSRKPSTESLAAFSFLRTVLHKMLALTALLLLASTLVPRIYPRDLATHLLVYILFVLLCAAAKASYMFTVSASKGFLVFETEAISNMLVGILAPLLGVVLLLAHQGLPAFMLLFGGSTLAQLLIAQWILRRRGIATTHLSPSKDALERIKKLVRWNFLLTLASQFSPKSIDTYLLGWLSLTVAVGEYNLAASISRAGTDVLVAGFSAIVLPYFSKAQADGGMGRVQEVFTPAVCIYQTIGLWVAGGGYLIAPFIIPTLYGNSFSGAIPAFQIMSATAGLSLPMGAYSAALIATDSVRVRATYIAGLSAISLGTSLALVPSLGFRGALFSIAIGEILRYLFSTLLLFALLNLRLPARYVARQWLAALISLALVMGLIPIRTKAATALVACCMYSAMLGILTVNLGGWRRQDLEMASRQSALLARLISTLRFFQPL
jgi:O-antigen/teichoic acid export membrane protein